MAPSPDAVLALASGVPLVLLGAALLAVRPHRREPVFFGLFAVLWGLQVAAANLGIVVGDPRVHRLGLLLSLGLVGPAYLFLAHFATVAAPRRGLGFATAALAIVAAAATGLLTLAPATVVASVGMREGAVATMFGPLALPLFAVPFFGTFYLALGILYAGYRSAPVGTARHRLRGLLLALALFASYTTVRQLFIFLDPPPSVAVLGPASTLGTAGLFVAGAVFLAALVLHLALRPPPPEERDRVLLAAFLAPTAVALAEVTLARAGGLAFESTGFWRLAAVASLVYALARHQLFDLDLKLRRAIGPALASLAVAYAALAALLLAAAGRAPDALPPLALGAAVAAGAVVYRDALGARLFPHARDAPEYVRRRKIEVYRASLEERLAAGAGDDAALRRLRRKLGITEGEHEVMAVLVAERAAAPVPEIAPRIEPGARVLARYRIDRLLGEGAYGRAFLAYDERDRREVAVKTVAAVALGGAAARALEREARVLAGIRHPNVIVILDVAETPRDLLLVLEYAAGGNLHGLLRRRGPLPIEEATRLLDGILAGLAAAHARGIVHRDVKPENVLLTKDGAPKVADFGVAREARADATAGAEGAGTLLYMSPEQVRGLPVDARSDLYAAGVLFHQLTTGRFYLRIAGADDFQVRRQIVETEPQLALRDAPPWLEPFLRRALAKDPAARFPSAEAMRGALAERLPPLAA